MRELAALRTYTLERSPDSGPSVKWLLQQLRQQLMQASNARTLLTSPSDIYKFVRQPAALPSNVNKSLRELRIEWQAFVIVGGEKNQERSTERQHFRRADGAWFDFSIVGRELKEQIEIIAYDFEIRLPVNYGAPFLRFDLNLPAHANEDRELRCHLHIGSDDVLVPAPLMAPSELLALMIGGVQPTRKARGLTQFERDWFRQCSTSSG